MRQTCQSAAWKRQGDPRGGGPGNFCGKDRQPAKPFCRPYRLTIDPANPPARPSPPISSSSASPAATSRYWTQPQDQAKILAAWAVSFVESGTRSLRFGSPLLGMPGRWMTTQYESLKNIDIVSLTILELSRVLYMLYRDGPCPGSTSHV